MRIASEKATQAVSPEALAAEIARLSALSTADLRAAWRAEFRREAPKGLWREFLLCALAWGIQEKAFGGHEKATLKLLAAYGRKKESEQLYQRLKSGTVLIRDFASVRHTVTITPAGFLWQEKTYPSLSAIAKLITGKNWNGPRFFGLREAKGKKAQQQGRTA